MSLGSGVLWSGERIEGWKRVLVSGSVPAPKRYIAQNLFASPLEIRDNFVVISNGVTQGWYGTRDPN